MSEVASPPSALSNWTEIASRLAGREVVVFLDYDGTLTPIVERPEAAELAPAMRRAIERLAALAPVVVISGRDRADVAKRVGVRGIFYAGGHGFDISGPDGRQVHRVGDEAVPAVHRAAARLERTLADVVGAQVEPKSHSVAVHFRRVDPADVPRVEAAVDQTLAGEPRLEKASGKKVWEVRPRIPWDKGKALAWILGALRFDRPAVTAFYLGDDTTDEDAFRALAERGDSGVGIVVLDAPRITAATYSLSDSSQVGAFLERLAGWLASRRSGTGRPPALSPPGTRRAPG